MKRVVLVGLGLVGGSIGRALRHVLPELELVGVDDEAVVFSELGRQLLTSAVATESRADATQLALDADLVVLAMPVGEISRQVTDWLRSGVPVTDCGSTKRVIVESAQSSPNRDWFVPGHPMAGRERGGLASSSVDLFRGRRWVVCPEGVREAALIATHKLVDLLGAIWTEMTPNEHDAAVALTSHVPQVLASWLAAAADERIRAAAGPAFLDMTRVAGGSEAMWKDIFSTNGDAIAKVVSSITRDLEGILRQLQSASPRTDLVLELLAKARNRQAPGAKSH